MKDLFNKRDSHSSYQRENVFGVEMGMYESIAALRGRPDTHVTVVLRRDWLPLRTRP